MSRIMRNTMLAAAVAGAGYHAYVHRRKLPSRRARCARPGCLCLSKENMSSDIMSRDVMSVDNRPPG